MGDLAIRVENLSKLYHIGKAQKRHDTLRDVIGDWRLEIGDWMRRLVRPTSNFQPPASDNTIWALKDVSFEVKRGEVVGIIGRNGAGKSTLLKILSRITEPTQGRAIIDGRVGSLLEVGTGFHAELTGRENIYLNGAILGMKRSDIVRKFDEIVEFAEVTEFVDTPVKHYSSGMYVRLGFAVAAHLEPEILLVDEVLAVGDARFWSKCMEKIRSLHALGTTILLVSHNMWQIQTACTRAMCIEQGAIVSNGLPIAVVRGRVL
jgi:lipopolysaccharide transport system ATP-binding protein